LVADESSRSGKPSRLETNQLIAHADHCMIHIHDAAALEQLRKKLGIEPARLRQFRNAFYKKLQTSKETLRQLSETERVAFENEVVFHSLELNSRHDSRLDGATKLLFRTMSGHLLESVILRIATGRTSLCVSSQIGCAVGCGFCATGQMESAQNLGYAEILDQVIQANRELQPEGRSIRNVVFMGMGEPLLNEAEVCKALEILLSPSCFDLSPRRVLVSTVGIPDAMLRCAQRFPRVGMALSLHSARQAQRERLIPLARRYRLESLRAAIERVNVTQHQPLMIEYLLLDGLTDTDADRVALIDFLHGLRVHINLIPYNSVTHAPELVGTPDERRHAFAASLRQAGHKVTLRHSLGADITAACGQLVQFENASTASRQVRLPVNPIRSES
jgi:23S rRNA (adenine2503-C2)-methyltransferase